MVWPDSHVKERVGTMKLFRYIAAGLLAAGASLALAGPASATEEPHHIPSECLTVSTFYGNPDEPLEVDGVKRVEGTADGVRLSGPSSLHREITGTKLADLPKHALLVQTVEQGSGALVKVETIVPSVAGTYSNIVFTADGVWSSKIAADQPGGQSHPVAGPADLIGLWSGYTDATIGFSVGFGYGNDAGNITLVKSLAYAGQTYDLTCQPVDESPSPGATKPPVKPKPKPIATPSELPLTGPGDGVNPLAILLPMAGALLLGGAAVVVGLRRRHRFTA
jgi:hypothetical protein